MPRLLHHISARYPWTKGQWSKRAKYEYCHQISSIDFPVQSSKIALFGARSRL